MRKGVEFFPMHYRMPSGMSFLGDLWVRKPPRRHAVAWPLRQAWAADSEHGPTYNASVNGRRYWARFGAQDTERDRFPTRVGPTEVSAANPEGRMDLTALVTDAAYGAAPGSTACSAPPTGCSWGTTQESIDHYYFAHSLVMQKSFADLGPSNFDRMRTRCMSSTAPAATSWNSGTEPTTTSPAPGPCSRTSVSPIDE